MNGQPQPANPEMDEISGVMYYDPSSGQILPKESLPEKTTRLYVILKRSRLVFNTFPLKSRKSIRLQDIFAVQKAFIPSGKVSYSNLIYRLGSKRDATICFWLGKIQLDHHRLFFDEHPETLLFRGKPEHLARYNLFVFNREDGFEVIHFDGRRLLSAFAFSETQLETTILQVLRARSITGAVRAISDYPLPFIEDVSVDRLPEDSPYYLLTDHTRIARVFSNISRDKKIRSIRRINRTVGRYLNVLVGLAVVLLLVQALFHLSLRSASDHLNREWRQVQRILRTNEHLEHTVRLMDQRLEGYPDHRNLLFAVAEAVDRNSYAVDYAIQKNRVELSGFSKNSMGILRNLETIPGVATVRFKRPVQKNIVSQTERFSIEMILDSHGQ